MIINITMIIINIISIIINFTFSLSLSLLEISPTLTWVLKANVYKAGHHNEAIQDIEPTTPVSQDPQRDMLDQHL